MLRARRRPGRPPVQRRQARRPAVRAADPLSIPDQPQDRQGDRPHRPAQPAGPRQRGYRVRRRALLAGLAVLPAGARAQTPARARIGVLSGLAENDPATQERLAALRAGLAAAGWQEGRNLTLDTRFAPTSEELAHRLVAELLALSPDLLIVQGPGVAAAQKATRSTPIVFVVTPDPVGAGFVASLARPGGNITGF